MHVFPRLAPARRRRFLIAAGFAALVAIPSLPREAAAQGGMLTVASMVPLSEKDLTIDGEKRFKEIGKVIVPTIVVRYVAKGSLFVSNSGRFYETGGGTAKAKGKFIVGGLEKEYVQGLSKQLYDDLVARLRAAGYTVLAYDDIKDNPEVQKMGRLKDDKDFGMPTFSGLGTKNTYLLGFPSDEMAIDPPFQGYGWGFRKVAKDLDAGVMIVEFDIDAPQLSAGKRNGIATRSASVSVNGEMSVRARMSFWTPKMAWGNVWAKGAMDELGDEVGEIGEAKDDSPRFANALAAGLAALSPTGADMQTKSGVWGMKINKELYTAAVHKAGASFNAAVASVAEKHKK